MVTNEGLQHNLDVMLSGATQVTTWYVLLIDNSPTPTLANADTMGSHAGWSESTAYAGSNRPSFAFGASTVASNVATATGSTSADFAINATPTIYGFGITSGATKGGTSGKLLCTAAFTGGAKGPLDATTTLKVTPSLTGQAV